LDALSPRVVALPSDVAGAVVQRGLAVRAEALLTPAQAMTEALATGEPVEVTSMTSADSLVVADPESGELVAELSPGPVRVQESLGEWRDVDLSLVRSPEGLRSVVSPADVVFGDGGDRLIARFRDGERSITLEWPAEFAVLPEPVVDGRSAVYGEVLPGVDLVARASEVGFATYVVVKTPEAAANPDLRRMEFGLSGEGLEVRGDDAGRLEAVDADGDTVFGASAPRMWDSRGKLSTMSDGENSLADEIDGMRRDGSGVVSGRESSPVDVAGSSSSSVVAQSDLEDVVAPSAQAQVLPVETNVRAGVLALEPDEALLSDPDATFPIVIDPDWYTAYRYRGAWAMVWNNGMDWFNAPGQSARVGFDGWSGQSKVSRVFYRFNTSAFRGAAIDAANFQHEVVHSPQNDCNATSFGPDVRLRRSDDLTGPVSWPGPSLGFIQDTMPASPGNAARGCGSDWPRWNATPAIRTASQNDVSTVTFALQSANESDRDGWRQFENSANFPVLTVKFNQRPALPGVPVIQNFGSSQWINTLTPTFSVAVRDPNGGQIGAQFEVYTLAGSLRWSGRSPAQKASPDVAVDAKLTVPAGVLRDGEQYFVQAKAYDEKGMSQGDPPNRTFGVDVTAPHAPRARLLNAERGVVSADKPVRIGMLPGVNAQGAADSDIVA